MKLTKEKIIEAAEAFNQANSFDEFKVKLEDFEKDYYEVASIHPVFANLICFPKEDKKFNSKAYMALDPKKIIPGHMIANRFKLPLWLEKDEFDTVKMLMPGEGVAQTTYSPDLAKNLKAMGIDPFKEMAQMLMYELGHV